MIALTERALGMAAHDGQGAIDRIRRDLNFYLRQADPDGLAMGSLSRVLADPALRGPVARYLEGERPAVEAEMWAMTEQQSPYRQT